MRGSMIDIDRLFITPSLSSIGIGVYTRCTHTKRWYTIFYSIRIGALTAYISRSAPLEVKWDRYIITISSGQWHPKRGVQHQWGYLQRVVSSHHRRDCRMPWEAEICSRRGPRGGGQQKTEHLSRRPNKTTTKEIIFGRWTEYYWRQTFTAGPFATLTKNISFISPTISLWI